MAIIMDGRYVCRRPIPVQLYLYCCTPAQPHHPPLPYPGRSIAMLVSPQETSIYRDAGLSSGETSIAIDFPTIQGNPLPSPRCRYLGFSHNAIGPPHLTAFITFWHFSYLENIHKE